MPLKPETRLRTKIIRYLRGRGGEWIVVHGGPYQAAGISDIIGCYHGGFWALEVKTPDKWKKPGHNMTELQVNFLEKIRSAGGVSACICSVKQACFLMEVPDDGPTREAVEAELEELV
jgi:penicillin-binding protein-related factor A (putative recombinase)